MIMGAQVCNTRQRSPPLLRAVLVLLCAITTHAAPNDAKFQQLGPKDEVPRLTVYVVSPPFAGHFLPLLAIAFELQSRGHNVTFLAPVQKGNEDVPKRVVTEAGIPFQPLGFTPVNKTEFDRLVAQARSGSNLLGAVKHFLEADLTAFLDMDELLSKEPHPDILVACNVYRAMGAAIEHKHGIPAVFNYMLENYFWRPSWPFPVLGSGLSDHMTFAQRLKNELVSFVNSYVIEPYMLKVHLPKILRQYGVADPPRAEPRTFFGAHGMPSIVNSAPGFDFSAPLPPSVIQTGPLTVPTAQPFPKPLQTWLDSQLDRSVVLVSLGTVNVIDERIARVIVEGLKGTGKTLLWALREQFHKALTGVDVPSNFRLEEWIPQRAVLAHRAIAAMVTHCGNNGVQEALANAVPPVGMPFVADQADVGARLAAAGFPVLQLASVTASELTSAVQSVTSLDVPDGVNTYQKRARRLARIFRAAGGVERAADFVEHIAELGSDHLQMTGPSMPWYVRHKYDTWLVVVLLFGTLLLGTTWVVANLWRKLFVSSSSSRVKRD